MKANKKKLQSWIFVTLCTILPVVLGERCSKSLSRVVRQQVKERIIPHYDEWKTKIPDSCLLSPSRDIYMMQEEKVMIESTSKYKCNVCGKAFMSQFYIDMHFDNRHPEYIREDKDAICYADYCDITRCDVMSGQRTPDFWDVSLCLEDDMKELRERCETIIDNCIPDGLTRKESKELHVRVNNAVCQFLTCKLYWEGPYRQGPDSVMLYSILTTFMAVFFIIYYCIGYHYFYTDTFSDMYDDEPRPAPVKIINRSELRKRLMDDNVHKEWREGKDRRRNEQFHDMFAARDKDS